MIVLALTVCLAAEPARCEPVELPTELNLSGCYLLGQSEVAAWLAERPWLTLRGWRCVAGVRS